MEYDDTQLIDLFVTALKAEKKKDPNRASDALKAHAKWRREKGISSYWIKTGKDQAYDSHN